MRSSRRSSAQVRRAMPPALALLATALTSVLALLIPAGVAARPVVVTPPATRTLICNPGSASKATLLASAGDDQVLVGPLDGAPEAIPVPASLEVSAAQRITGASPLVGGMYVAEGVQRSWAGCQPASSVQVLQTADPATATLWLTNPDARAVTVDLTLSSDTGDVTSAGARGIQVGPHTTRAVPLSVLAQAGHPLGVVVRTDQGRVAAVIESTALGLTKVTGSMTGTSLMVAGVPAKAASVRLIVTNSGNQRAMARVQALVEDGPFVPQGGDGVSLEVANTIVLDLTGPLDGQAAGMWVTSDQPLSVTAVVTTPKDTASIAASAPAKDQSVVVPADGVVQISNPQTVAVKVELAGPQSQSITLPAGATWSGPAPAKSELRVTSEQPVGVAVVVGGTEGVAVVGSALPAGGATPVPVRVDPGLR